MIRLIIKPTAHLIKLQTSLLVANIRRQSLSTVRMNVIPIEALSDNYMYLIVDEATKECAAVDPVEPHKILERIKKENLKLTKVLTTHHHWDHADGNPALVKEIPVPVYGGDDRIPALSNKVGHNETFKIGSNLNVRTLFTPCHTTGHICYYVTVGPNESEEKAVFTGDTLFISGCGRFFEGTAKQMHHALIEVLSKLPSETKVYCGHEYTVQNLKFSLHVESDNQVTVEKLKWAENKRSSKERTIPSTIGDEMKFNPFMRVEHESLKKRYGVSDPIECMTKLRSEKDNWKST